MRIVLLIAAVILSCRSEEKMSERENNSFRGAEVTSVSVSGGAGAYTFSVEIKSPDTGCEQYADWWEVLSEDAQLIYRRILTHSHVTEQPFTRSGGPFSVDTGQIIIVRAHMNNLGYGARGMRGSIEAGFEFIEIPEGFGLSLATQEPQPGDCPN